MGSRRDNCPLDCKVYVGELGNSGSRPELEQAFSYFGPLRNVWVARNPPGFAFVMFENPRDARDSVESLDGKIICGRKVKVELSSGKTRRETSSRRMVPRDLRRFSSRGRSPRGRGYYRDTRDRDNYRSRRTYRSRSRSRSSSPIRGKGDGHDTRIHNGPNHTRTPPSRSRSRSIGSR